MLQRIIRAVGAELRCCVWEYTAVSALFAWAGCGLFALLGFVFGDGDYLRAAPIVAVSLAAFCSWLFTLLSFAYAFQMALSMGRTRRLYGLSAFLSNLLSTLASVALCYPTAWLVYGLQIAGGLARPDTSPDGELGFVMFHQYWPVLLAGALLAVLLGSAMGALMMRFGQKGFWVVWALCIFGGTGMSWISRIRSGPVGALVAGLRAWANGLSVTGWWGAFALVAAVLAGCTWLMVRRAAVR